MSGDKLQSRQRSQSGPLRESSKHGHFSRFVQTCNESSALSAFVICKKFEVIIIEGATAC